MEEEQKKKGNPLGMVFGMIAVGILALAALYLCIAIFFTNRLLIRTSVNGEDCSVMTVHGVQAYLEDAVDEYVLQIQGRGGIEDSITGSDIDMEFHGVDSITGAIQEQNELLWIVSIFEPEDVDANLDITYNRTKLERIIEKLNCTQKENQREPISATPVYCDGSYLIQEEVEGCKIDAEKLMDALDACISQKVVNLDLEDADCYVHPDYRQDSQEVLAAAEAMNQCLEADISYKVGKKQMHVETADIVSWISVDKHMKLEFDKEQMLAFAEKVADRFDTKGGDQKFVTPTGRKTVVVNGKKGRRVSCVKEYKQLMLDIAAGAYVVREPEVSQAETGVGNYAWGKTYLEVDIVEQHMWYFEDDILVFESDVVTGSPGRDTPIGMFEILEKLSPKVLTGYLPNGKLEYKTPVKFWARVTWSGIGFHDATWQPAFGGERYQQGYGSHGCINLPYQKMAELYEMISVGCPVIIHK